MKQTLNGQNHEMILNHNPVVAKVPPTDSAQRSKFNLLNTLNQWIIREKHRRYLLQLPDYLLDDIGLTRNQVVNEGRKPFWKRGLF